MEGDRDARHQCVLQGRERVGVPHLFNLYARARHDQRRISFTTFAIDIGYASKQGWKPGVSVFKRESTQIVRVSDAGFKPGDDFCTMWHFLDLFPGGYGGWMPKFDYGNPDSKRVVPSCCAD